MPLPKVIHPAVYAIHKSIKNSLPFLAGREFLLLSVFQKFHAEIVFPGHTLLRVLLSYLSSLPKCWHESSVPRARADRSELIFSAQPNALKRWQRAYYKAFLRFLPGLWADSRRSFPGTQLAFSIWVPGPLLTPYSQNTHSNHRNPSNSQYSRAAQLMASLSAQPPRISVRETGITGHGKPICPTAPDGLLILLKIPLNCLFHSLCIQRICLCLISCNQLNCGDDSICNIILLLGHGTSDIGAVIY